MKKHSCQFCHHCKVEENPDKAFCTYYKDKWRPLPEEWGFHGLTIENGCGLHSFRETSALTGDKYREPQKKDHYFETL